MPIHTCTHMQYIFISTPNNPTLSWTPNVSLPISCYVFFLITHWVQLILLVHLTFYVNSQIWTQVLTPSQQMHFQISHRSNPLSCLLIVRAGEVVPFAHAYHRMRWKSSAELGLSSSPLCLHYDSALPWGLSHGETITDSALCISLCPCGVEGLGRLSIPIKPMRELS